MMSSNKSYPPLREKCPNTELFLVCIFPHSDSIRKDTSYLSAFSPNAGKYRPEITLYLDTFHAVLVRGNSNVVNFSKMFQEIISESQQVFILLRTNIIII